jgi:hypothetical protein
LGAHIVDLLLERGIVVVVTARSESKAEVFMQRRSRFSGSLEMVVTGDLTGAVGAFDDLAKDVDVIIHCASVSSVVRSISPRIFVMGRRTPGPEALRNLTSSITPPLISTAITERTLIGFNAIENDNRARDLRDALHPPSRSKEPRAQTARAHVFHRGRARYHECGPSRFLHRK